MTSPTKLNVGIVKLIALERQEMINTVLEMHKAQGCGVCEKSGAEVFWFSHISHFAHTVCYQTIKDVEADLNAKINSLYKDNQDRNNAHVKAIRAVKKELGTVSIKTYLETNGAKNLKLIFDSVGLNAAITPTAKL
jgi:homoserine trans-succinylase